MGDCPCDVIVPLHLEIAAGLDALPRQLRAFPEVRRALLAAIPGKPALREWRARNSQDLGLMLLEMWAYVADVLGFYDERIANESYLRTAQRRPSLRRLVELIGFIPAPGIAGSVTLAAIAEGRLEVTLPLGTAFRSDAFAGEGPQVYEITEAAVIHPLRNEWTVGPVPSANLPQPTPTEVAQRFIEPASARTFFVFAAANVGAVAGDIVVISAFGQTVAAGVARVADVRNFAGKDGRAYAEVRLDRPVALPFDGLPTSAVSARKPVSSIRAAPFEDEAKPPIVGSAGSQEGEFKLTVNLEAENTQIVPADLMVIRKTSGNSETLATAVVESVTTTTVTNGVITVPVSDGEGGANNHDVPRTSIVSQIVLVTGEDFSDDGTTVSNPSEFTFFFRMVSAGTITTVAKIDLSRDDVEAGLPVTGIVQPPPDARDDNSGTGTLVLNRDFLLFDPDKHGASVSGKMRFDSTGRATLVGDAGSLNPPEQTFKTPLTVLGNLLRATRGETVNAEVLGSGDPRAGGQRFKLKRKPLTYLLANDIDRLSTLKVFVDNVEWREVRSFFNCTPESRTFIVRHDDDQETFVIFGDGVRGARLPAGVGNVVATYRFGSGKAAPPAGAITQIARPVIGLRSVRSPIAATEGRDADGPEELRETAPRSALLFDRAVSVRDFEIVVAQQAGVVKVIAAFAWIPALREAGVVVRYIGTPSEIDVREGLRARSELNLVIDVHKAQAVPATLRLTLEIDPAFRADPVMVAVRAALLDPKTGPLAPANAPIGGQFLAAAIFETVQAVAGVVAIQSATLEASSGFTDFGETPIACVEPDRYFSFDAEAGVDITPSAPTGAVSASRPEGC
jgi:hypothetical protein